MNLYRSYEYLPLLLLPIDKEGSSRCVLFPFFSSNVKNKLKSFQQLLFVFTQLQEVGAHSLLSVKPGLGYWCQGLF